MSAISHRLRSSMTCYSCHACMALPSRDAVLKTLTFVVFVFSGTYV